MTPDSEIGEFWEVARTHVGVGPLVVLTGPGPAESVAPPAWAFGDSPEVADDLLARVLAGTKTATASAVWEYDEADEPLPRAGDVSIILDGRGHPGALVRTTAVRVVPFAEVDARHAWLEGEQDRSLESWRSVHEARFGRVRGERDPGLRVVLERFELRFPQPRAVHIAR